MMLRTMIGWRRIAEVRVMSKCLGAILVALCSISVSTSADVLHVWSDGSGDYPTIQAAVDAATDGDLILLGDGVFRGPGNWDVEVVDKNITIASESGDPMRTVIDCEDGGTDHRAWLVMFNNELVVFEGVGVIHGDMGEFCGGAAVVVEGTVTLRNCVFAGNRGLYGGAIVTQGWCLVSLVSCTFFDNEATAPGGGSALAMDDVGWAYLDNCIVVFGRAGRAFESLGGSIDLACCDVYGNDGGDYTGPVAGQLGVNGNISEDPLFCDPGSLNLSIAEDSPCAPDGECGLIGALPVGCGPTPAEVTTWGRIKELYRAE